MLCINKLETWTAQASIKGKDLIDHFHRTEVYLNFISAVEITEWFWETLAKENVGKYQNFVTPTIYVCFVACFDKPTRCVVIYNKKNRS